jgi:hypothetical protein
MMHLALNDIAIEGHGYLLASHQRAIVPLARLKANFHHADTTEFLEEFGQQRKAARGCSMPLCRGSHRAALVSAGSLVTSLKLNQHVTIFNFEGVHGNPGR